MEKEKIKSLEAMHKDLRGNEIGCLEDAMKELGKDYTFPEGEEPWVAGYYGDEPADLKILRIIGCEFMEFDVETNAGNKGRVDVSDIMTGQFSTIIERLPVFKKTAEDEKQVYALIISASYGFDQLNAMTDEQKYDLATELATIGYDEGDVITLPEFQERLNKGEVDTDNFYVFFVTR